MKRILWFFVKALVFAFVAASLWLSDLGDAYMVVVAKAMNGTFELTGFDSIEVEAKGKRLVFVEVDALFHRRTVGTMQGVSLVMNMVPLVALMLATPGVGLRERVETLVIAMIVLFVTHVAHTFATFYVVTHRQLQVSPETTWMSGKVIAYYFFQYFYTFWEGMGRMLTPFVLWGLLNPRMIFGPDSLLALGGGEQSA